MSDKAVREQVEELCGKIDALFDGVPAGFCLDALVNEAANVLCQAHANKDKARLDGWNFGKNLEMVIAEKFEAYREAMETDDELGKQSNVELGGSNA